MQIDNRHHQSLKLSVIKFSNLDRVIYQENASSLV